MGRYIAGRYQDNLLTLMDELKRLTKKEIGKLKVARHKRLKASEKKLKEDIKELWKLDRKLAREEFKSAIGFIAYLLKKKVTRYQVEDLNDLLRATKKVKAIMDKHSLLLGPNNLNDLIKLFNGKLANPSDIERSQWQKKMDYINSAVIKYLSGDKDRSWSTSQLAEHIAFNGDAGVKASTIKQNYLPLIMDSAEFPAHVHYCPQNGTWWYGAILIK